VTARKQFFFLGLRNDDGFPVRERQRAVRVVQ
jgi:hypothetical protein